MRKKININTISLSNLMSIRLKDMSFSKVPTYIKAALQEILAELKSQNLIFCPKSWVSDEWFCPDGTAGIGIPFYLCSDRLIKIEKKEIGFIEGETLDSAKKLIRHEVGHIIDNIFKLKRNRERQQLFGQSSIKYPSQYYYRPFSKQFVKHLGEGYAQSHPTEDFAETFAVWLNPQSNWRKKYQGQKCIDKLFLMDKLMSKIKGTRPVNYDKNKYYDISEMKITYGQYLKKRKAKFNKLDGFWNDLQLDLLTDGDNSTQIEIEKYFSLDGKQIVSQVSRQTGHSKYLIKYMLEDIKKNNSGLKIDRDLSSFTNMSYHISKNADKFIEEKRHYISL